MISALNSEEFVPYGRIIVEEHPGPYKKLIMGDYYFQNPCERIEQDMIGAMREIAEAKNEEIDAEREEMEDYGPHEPGKYDLLLNKLHYWSLEEKEMKAKEYWTVRTPKNLFETSSKKLCTKNSTNHNVTTSFYGDSINFRMSISNRSKLKNKHSIGSENVSSNSKFSPYLNEKSRKMTVADHPKETTKFTTRLQSGGVEDELYIKGQTLVWSRRIVNSCSSFSQPMNKTICSYTCDDHVFDYTWCTFFLERPTYDVSYNDITSKYKELPCLSIVHDKTIKVFAESGEDFEIALPFGIDSVHPTAFGILIVKDMTGAPKNDPSSSNSILYSISHPLEDIYPVVINKGFHAQILNNPNISIVKTIESPSLCVLYDKEAKQNFVYRIRKCKLEEKDFYEKSLGLNSTSTANNSLKLKSRLSMWNNIPGTLPSILNSAERINSFANLQGHSKTHSPMVGMRCQSTCPPADISQPSSVYSMNRVISLDMSRSLMPIKQFPAICLEQVWVEPPSEEGCKAYKVFICDDLAGQKYFCYVRQSILYLLKADFSDISYKFGASSHINAKDAVPIPHLHMIAVLEHTYNVTLYSGMTVVGKLHLDGTLVKHTPTPYIRRFQTKLNSSFPRRSSLLPYCDEDDDFDEELYNFSPVLPSDRQNAYSTSVTGLRDALENCITLIYSDKTYYRVKFPLFATSPLVEHCLNALRQCLNRDAIMALFTKWYSTRNGLGTHNCTDQQEWEMFTSLLFDLLGYEEEQNDTSKDDPQTPSMAAKKSRPSFVATDDDWKKMLDSEYNKMNTRELNALLKFQDKEQSHSSDAMIKQIKINSNAILFPYIKLIHFSFHIMYEDFKLDKMLTSLLRPLAMFLNQISNDMSMFEYSLLYWKDFPDWCEVGHGNRRFVNENEQVNLYDVGYDGVFNIMEYLSLIMQGRNVSEFPYLKEVNERSRDIVQLCSIVSDKIYNSYNQGLVIKPLNEISADIPFNEIKCNSVEEVILLMTQMNITTDVLNTLPFGLYLFFYDVLWKCRENPPADWPTEAYLLLQREDLAYLSNVSDEVSKEPSAINSMVPSVEMNITSSGPEQITKDGMENVDSDITNLIFPDDMRVEETRSMLQSSRPVEIAIVQRPDISDHDFIEEQEKHLFAVCTRTMALPVGRGMFSFQTTEPLMIRPVYTPPLCLTGRGAPRGTTIELSHIDSPSNMNLWPLFHNGVAAGLTVSSNANIIDKHWIVFNKPKTSEKDMEYGGFLLAMGLHGYLKRLDVWNTYQHLSRKHEMITVGVLLGFASTHRGSCHIAVTKMLSVHLEALFPPTSMELDHLTHAPQVTSLLSIGLLYEGTAHSHMAEVLLSEIGRPPGPEMENSTDRESYSLAAGLGLGLVMLQRGGKSGSQDMNISDMLHYYITGGIKRPFTGAQKDKYKVPSFQIREGDSVNLDVTAPGATLALGLMYMGSMNKTIAEWMSPPETQYLLDFIRPDFLMLRVISKSLIMWYDIQPSKDWIENQVPKNIRPYCMVQPSASWGDVDYEAMNQAYCNIIAGACFSMGLRYAGTADERAFRALLQYCHMFLSLTGKSISELAGKTTIETCLNVLLLSIAMVMAGTGNLEVMKLIRHLRRRVGVSSSAIVTYGSHLAIHMALGLLFLGGGKFTLSNSPSSVAALICAFYPKFPNHSNDNRYHLQAFRHLYVLAVETRLIIPRDLSSGKSCYANLRIVQLNGTCSTLKAPATLPNLNTLNEVVVEDERYWKIIFKKDVNWNILEDIVLSDGIIEVKQRAGCQSYLQDKIGNHSLYAKTITESNLTPWNPSPYTIKSFTSNESLKLFCENFLDPNGCCAPGEEQIKTLLTRITYKAAIHDKLAIIPAFTSVIKMMQHSSSISNNFQLWQLKILLAHVKNSVRFNILPKHLMDSIIEEVELKIESWEKNLLSDLKKYVGGMSEELGNQSTSRCLAAFVNLFDVPHNFVGDSAEYSISLLSLLD